tara:strand:+ start:353 stop:496 length:144 start_codon:yes stop_codon:yes gene_type:complete
MLSGENSDVALVKVAVAVTNLPKAAPDDNGVLNLNLLVLSVLPSMSV